MVEDGVKLQDAFDGIKSKDEDLEILTDDTVQPLLKEVEDELLKGTSEEEAVKHFLDEINREIQKNLTQKRHITGTALQEWKKNMQFHKLQSLSTPPSKAPPQLTSRGLPEDQYQWYRDFNYYYTNNYICAALVGVAAVATPVFFSWCWCRYVSQNQTFPVMCPVLFSYLEPQINFNISRPGDELFPVNLPCISRN